MSILTGFKKVKNYILTSSGYQLLSRWTSSQTVEFDDGKTAQTKLGEINGIAKTYVDMKKATDNSMAVSAKAVMEGLENSSALISMTQAEYDALSDEEKTDNNMRAILDANPDVVDAKNVNFDNTNTDLTATNTQSAITELNGKLKSVDYDITFPSGVTTDFVHCKRTGNIVDFGFRILSGSIPYGSPLATLPADLHPKYNILIPSQYLVINDVASTGNVRLMYNGSIFQEYSATGTLNACVIKGTFII